MKIPALLAVVWLAFAAALGQTLSVDVPQEPITAKPREVLFTGLRLYNPLFVAVTVQAKLQLPQGWQELAPPEALHIEGGRSEVLYLTVLPPANAPAQLYWLEVQLSLSATGRNLFPQSARVPVRIAEVYQLEWQAIESPSVIVGQPYSARFALRNLSNVSQSLQLSASSRLGKVERLQPSQAVIAPGEVLEVQLTVQPPQQLIRAQTDLIQLSAQSQSNPALRAVIRATPTWYPPNQTALDRYERIPAQAQVEVGSNRPLDYSFQLSGPFSQGRLSLRLDRGGFLGSYANRAWGFSVGKQGFGYTALSRTSLQGWGFSLQAQIQSLSLKAFALDPSWLATGPTASELGVGAQAVWQLQPRSSLSVQWGLTPVLGSLFSARLDHSANLGPGVVYQTQLEYAWQSQGPTSALEVQGGLGVGGFSIGGGYLWRGEQFLGASASQNARANVGYTWPQGKVALEASGRWSAQQELGLKAELNLLQWQAIYNWRQVQPTNSEGTAQQKLSLNWNPTLDPESRAKVGLSLEQTSKGGQSFHQLGLSAEVNSQNAQGYWRPSVGVSMGLESRTTSLSASLAAGMPVGTGTLKGQASLSLSGGLSRFSFSVGYSLPLEVPVALRPNVAEFSGQVLNSQQQGQAGLVLTVAGLAAVTNDQGQFYFAAVPAGTHQVTLMQANNDQLLLSEPALPLSLTFTPGQHQRLQLRLIEPARLNGRIVLSPASPIPPSLRGMRIEATNQSTVLYQTTDDQGRFAFVSLLPGLWTFRVLQPSLPAGFTLSQSQTQLSFVAGQTQGWEVQLIERIRTVPVQEGGTLDAP